MTPTLITALRDLLALAEKYESQIECEWGECRNLKQMEKAGDLAPEITIARMALTKAEQEAVTHGLLEACTAIKSDTCIFGWLKAHYPNVLSQVCDAVARAEGG